VIQQKKSVEATTPRAVDEVQTLKTSYEVASHRYHEIMRRNLERVVAGARLEVEEVRREDEAQERLALARRAYLDRLIWDFA
jgi:hypothetical protein